MKKGILGRKLGMTQVFTKSGKLIPVTVIEVEPNVVTQIKTMENDGYEAIQLGFDTKREKLVNKASIGHTNKANTTPKRFFKEIRGVDINAYTLGQEITADIFEAGEKVDVIGTSKGHGTAGTIKRWNFARLRETHGTGPVARHAGSLGVIDPARIFKGKKMAGHYGVDRTTVQNLTIAKVDVENNLIAVKGAIPGPKGGIVVIANAKKA